MKAQTIIVDPMEQLTNVLRAQGVPIASIKVTDGWINGGEPDAVATENGMQRSFYAPHFHWRTQDGRRFYGKPPIHLKRQRVRRFFGLIDYEVVYEDRERMMRDVVAMIRETPREPPNA